MRKCLAWHNLGKGRLICRSSKKIVQGMITWYFYLFSVIIQTIEELTSHLLLHPQFQLMLKGSVDEDFTKLKNIIVCINLPTILMLCIAQILFALRLKRTGTNEIVSGTNARYSCRNRSRFLNFCSGSRLPENLLHHPLTCGAFAHISPLCFTLTL
jgi:hypothetical protein